MEILEEPKPRNLSRLAHAIFDQMRHVYIPQRGAEVMLDELLMTEDLSGAGTHSELYDIWVADGHGQIERP